MSGGVIVTGGIDGIRAHLDDMALLRRILTSAADRVEGVIATCYWQSITLADLSGSGDGWGGLLARDALRSPICRLDGLDADLRGLAFALTLAIDGYHDADNGVLGQLGSVLTAPFKAQVALPGAVIDSAVTLWNHGASAAAQSFIADDPELIDTTVTVLGQVLPPVDRALLKLLADTYFADGHPTVTSRTNIGSAATAPPRRLTDLMAGLSARGRGDPGEVDVKILTGPDGSRRVIVDVPGTRSWAPVPRTANVAGVATNIRAIDGAPTSYERGVLEAMTQAGVGPRDDVMIVGHSLGGMVAVALARDAVRSGRFNVTHVVTAGSPIGKFVAHLPARVQVLALENRHDVVPHLDGAANPDLPNVTTATFDVDDDTIGDNHGLDTSYGPGAAAVQASDDPGIRAFLRGADAYLGAARVRTHCYVIARA